MRKRNNNINENGNLPIIQWLGGKRWAINMLEPRYIPPAVDEYHEPFAGGLSIYLHILNSKRPVYKYISDLNPDLINFYKTLQDHVLTFNKYVAKLVSKQNRGMYFAVREAFNKRTAHPILQAAMFYYFNCSGWRGLMRYNRKGHVNTPPRAKFLPFARPEEFVSFSTKIADSDIQCRDFRYLLEISEFSENSFVVMDPPYEPLSKTANFTGYAGKTFTWQDQLDVKAVMDHLTSLGVRCIAFNNDLDSIKALYHQYYCIKLPTKRSIGVKNHGGKATDIYELAFFNYDPDNKFTVRSDRL